MNRIISAFAVASLTLVVLLSATMASTYAQNDTQTSTNQTYLTNATEMNSTVTGSEDALEEDLETAGEISQRRRSRK
jgi:hypothetical protein